MATVIIENGGYLKEIFQLLDVKNMDCNWLISALECYDYCGWEGCQRWSEKTLFLSAEELLHDVNLRNMQFVWGVLSAIPKEYTEEQARAYPMLSPEDYDGGTTEKIVMQHPLAVLEIASVDSTYVTVTAPKRETLAPLYQLRESVKDMEKENRRSNEEICRIEEVMDRVGLSREDSGGWETLRWSVWHSLFREHSEPVTEDAILAAVAARRKNVSPAAPKNHTATKSSENFCQ